jgi:hypothetical protein
MLGRRSYFSACTMARNDPSYDPTARATATFGSMRRQRRQL